jgi:hypothetical protein
LRGIISSKRERAKSNQAYKSANHWVLLCEECGA